MYDPYDRNLYPGPNPPPASAPAISPAKGTVVSDMGAYGGPGASTIGSYTAADDPATTYIREDIIGTFGQQGPQ